MSRAAAVVLPAYKGGMTLTRLRIALQRHLVRVLNRLTCRAYDRLVDLENP